MNAHDNDITLTLIQTENGGVLSRLTLEYPNMPNDTANTMNLALVGAIAKLASDWAKAKAEGSK